MKRKQAANFSSGERKTPTPFVNACSQFIYTENLREEIEQQDETVNGGSPKPTVETKWGRNQLRGDTVLVRTLRTAVEQTADDDGWAHLELSDLIRASELFEISMRDKNVVYIKSP